MRGKIIQFQFVPETEKFNTTLYVLTEGGEIWFKVWDKKNTEPEWQKESIYDKESK